MTARAALIALILLPSFAWAQEVSPRLTFMGRGILTTDVHLVPGEDFEPDWALVNFSDTALSSRVDQVLFGGVIGSFAAGVRFTEVESPVAPAYLRQAEIGVQGEHLVVVFGRGRRLVTGLDYPTLRDEDLLTFRYPLSGWSAGGLEEDVLFSDRLALTARADFRWHALVFLESLRDTVSTGDPGDAGPPEPNALGVRLFYQEIPALSKVEVVKYGGVAFFGQRAGDDVGEPDDEYLWQVKAATALNLFPDPIHMVDLRLEGMFQQGHDRTELADLPEAWRARAVMAAMAVRYLWAPYQLERLQASVSGGYRRLVDADVQEWRVIPTLVWRLGVGVDLGVQYTFSHRDAALAAATKAPEDEHVVQAAFIYTFEVSINDSFVLPGDILDAEYDYVPKY